MFAWMNLRPISSKRLTFKFEKLGNRMKTTTSFGDAQALSPSTTAAALAHRASVDPSQSGLRTIYKASIFNQSYLASLCTQLQRSAHPPPPRPHHGRRIAVCGTPAPGLTVCEPLLAAVGTPSQNGEAATAKGRARGRRESEPKADPKPSTPARTRKKVAAPPLAQALEVEVPSAGTAAELDVFLLPGEDTPPVAFGPESLVLGVDPDVNGAVALLRGSLGETSAEVLDVPIVKVVVGSTLRRRHDPRAMAAMIAAVQAPPGTTVYIEQPRPVPLDGKQGWYSAGYGFGVWMGVLHALRLHVVPVHPANWKRALGIVGRGFTKDDSRELALRMFPTMLHQLRRKKDHGRAEALLIAQHGRMLAACCDPLPPFVRAVDTEGGHQDEDMSPD